MPVYIRKNVSFTPPSIHNMQLEDDSDYLLDPDQMRDILPQPYRMIDKILTQLMDSAWEIIEGKEKALLAEAQKVRPPQYRNPEELSIHNDATAMAATEDGKYVFIGHPKGLAAMDALSQTPIHKWEEEHVEIANIRCYPLAENCHLLTTLDDMAVCRIFVFAFERIFIVKTMNENSPETSSNILCQKCESSNEGDYMGVVLENTSTKETWFEAHKLPVESWLKEFENIQAAITKQKEENEKAMTSADEPDVEESELAADVIKETPEQDEVPAIDAMIEKMGIKFTHPTIVLKIKSPLTQLPPANASSSIASAVSKVDQGDVLGVGLSHVLSAAHIEARDAMFQHKHENLLEFMSPQETDVTMSASFHFVNPGRLNNVVSEPSIPLTKPNSVLVWWTGKPHLCHYSLLSTGKDIEFKPEIVWPVTSNITCSAVSTCTSHLAMGLENGNLILWDFRMGLPLAVLSVSSSSALKSVRFLDTALFPFEAPDYPPYPVSSAAFVLAECVDGTQSLYDTCDGSQQIPRCIASRQEDDDECQTLLRIIPSLPELMFYVQKNGQMFIKDVGTGMALCEMAMPPTHSIQTPWNPIFALGGGGQILYLKGEGKDVNEEGDSIDTSCLFKYFLRSYPVLDEYWNRSHTKKDLAVYTTIESRVEALLKERLQQQAARKPRMQKRWGQLRSDLNIIQHARAIPIDSLVLSI